MTDWVRWGYDLGSSGKNAAETGSGNKLNTTLVDDGLGTMVPQLSTLVAKPGWTNYATGAAITVQVVCVGGYLYVGSTDGYFYKINATTGALVTRLLIASPINSTPHVIGGVAYFGADDGYLYAVTVATMALLWRSTVQDAGPVRTHPVVVGTRVFYGTETGYLRAALLTTGAESWSAFAGTEVDGVVTACRGALGSIDGDIFVASSSVHRYTTAGAAVRVYWAANQSNGVALQAFAGQSFLAFSSEDFCTYFYDATTGERLWVNRQAAQILCSPALDLARGYVVIGTHNWSIQPHVWDTGELWWKRDGTASAAVTSGFALANGLLFGVWPVSTVGGDGDGRLVGWVLDQDRGGHVSDWKMGTFTGISYRNAPPSSLGDPSKKNKGNSVAPTPVNGTVYWAASDGVVYAFA